MTHKLHSFTVNALHVCMNQFGMKIVFFTCVFLSYSPTEEKPEATLFHGSEEVKLNEMTQAHLRSFIPRMLRAFTGFNF